MTHTIEVYIHVRGQFLRCVSVQLTDATRIGETVKMIQIETRFSEPQATFTVMIDGEIYSEGEY